jgi:8-oxo-dGTP pyrophosphatase MutT (NUDIX family)
MPSEKASHPPRRIRPIAICVFRHAGCILVNEFYDPLSHELFYRPLGGAIEYGEYSVATVRREIEEEIGAQVDRLQYLGTIENIFTYNGAIGHEIVQVYDGRFIDPAFYQRFQIDGYEDPEHRLPLKALWKSLDEFQGFEALRLVPDGLLELLMGQANC